MKAMKKFTTFMLTICMLLACFSMSVFAADGKIMFTDPQTKAGETVEITGVVQKTAGNFGKIEITMKYDTDMLKFKEGNGVTETAAGKLTYAGDATNDTGERKEFKFSFTALKEGTTKIEITQASVKNVAGTVLNYTKGSSTVTIAAGQEGTVGTTTTPTTVPADSEATVVVAGVSYTISNTFPEDAIPEGYEAAKLDYDMTEYDVVYSEAFGLYLAYLVNAENAGDFFMYKESDATFVPYEEIKISDSVTIALLSDVSDIVLPDEYKATTVLLNDHEFPAWKTEGVDGFCVLYAINNRGEKSLYQLDNTEGTYQRFTAPEENQQFAEDSLIGKLSNLLENHLDYVILGVGLGFLLFLLIIVVLGVKLYNRNAELDEIYDEYGIGDEEDTKDDILLEIDDEEEYEEEYDEPEEITEEELEEASSLVQEGLQELVEEKVEKEPAREIVFEIPKETEKKAIVEEEESLGKALQEVVAHEEEEKEPLFEDEEDTFENFSVDFIDLDD